jgi:hypothetical protein
VHIEMLGCLVILTTCIVAVATKHSINAGMAELSVTYSLNVSSIKFITLFFNNNSYKSSENSNISWNLYLLHNFHSLNDRLLFS